MNNPFADAYVQSDLMGKGIFIALYALSVGSWSLLFIKFWITRQARRQAVRFHELFHMQRLSPLNLDCEVLEKKGTSHPFLSLYLTLKKHCLEVLTKNRHFNRLASPSEARSTYLSQNDIHFVASHLATRITQEVKQLEQSLYLLSMTVSLAPFLGLLGTVWGILSTFSALQGPSMASNHQMVLSGLSLALATTVVGLLDAIPALIGYTYLKHTIRDFALDMEHFSHELLAAIELQYRRVESSG